MRGICMNEKCLDEGACDYCDARCPNYTDEESLLRVINAQPNKDLIVAAAHKVAMLKILQKADKEKGDQK